MTDRVPITSSSVRTSIRPDRQLVRRLRRLTRAAVKADPALRRERRRVTPRRTAQIRFSMLRWLVPLMIVGSASGASPSLVAGFLSVWTLAITLMRAGQVVAQFLPGPALWTYYCLPVENDAVFRRQMSMVFRSAVWLGIDWLAFGLPMAVRHESASAWIAIVVFAGAQALTALALACALARWQPRFPFAGVGLILAAGMWIVVQFADRAGAEAAVQPLLRGMMLGTPGGWLATAHLNLLAGGVVGWIAPLAAIAAGVVLLRRMLALGSSRFRMEEIFGYDSADAECTFHEPELTHRDDVDAAEDSSIEPLRTTHTTPAASDHNAWRAKVDAALSGPPGLALFHRGGIERQATRLLSVRDRVLIDVLRPQGSPWVKAWLTSFALISMAAVVRAAGYNQEWLVWLSVVGLVAGALPLLGGRWTGLDVVPSANGVIGVYAYYPLSFFSIAWLILRLNVLRCILAVPLVLMAVRFGFTAIPLPWIQTLGLTAKIMSVILAIAPLSVLMAFSKSTNDTSARWPVVLLFIAMLGIWLLFGLGLGVTLFAADLSAGVSALLAIVLVGMSHAVLAAYGWAWGRGWIDLVGKPPPML